jgi:hypothetical protein
MLRKNKKNTYCFYKEVNDALHKKLKIFMTLRIFTHLVQDKVEVGNGVKYCLFTKGQRTLKLYHNGKISSSLLILTHLVIFVCFTLFFQDETFIAA